MVVKDSGVVFVVGMVRICRSVYFSVSIDSEREDGLCIEYKAASRPSPFNVAL